MSKLALEQVKLSKKIKFIIKERYSKKCTTTEVFADIVLAECKKGCKNNFTANTQSDIMKLPTVQS